MLLPLGEYFIKIGYFAVAVGNVNLNEVQKYIEEQKMHHKQDNFRISEFHVYTLNPLCKR